MGAREEGDGGGGGGGGERGGGGVIRVSVLSCGASIMLYLTY